MLDTGVIRESCSDWASAPVLVRKKDGTVRYWDGDRFEMILVLRGHSAEVNCLAVSARNQGAVCLSGGMDRQVRVWERTRDIVFLEEERERELEAGMYTFPTNQEDDPKETPEQQTIPVVLDDDGGKDDNLDPKNGPTTHSEGA